MHAGESLRSFSLSCTRCFCKSLGEGRCLFPLQLLGLMHTQSSVGFSLRKERGSLSSPHFTSQDWREAGRGSMEKGNGFSKNVQGAPSYYDDKGIRDLHMTCCKRSPRDYAGNLKADQETSVRVIGDRLMLKLDTKRLLWLTGITSAVDRTCAIALFFIPSAPWPYYIHPTYQ
ncbi:hypothetical protein VNO77_02489 [Canavalia gladiata]|uniref:Uncharacterized protein n=1 Tax=Canavalia gladiata TaxID=3824 RepID=A0AAN9MTR9_CANGL